MNIENYLQMIKSRLENNFNIELNKEIGNQIIDLYAVCNIHSSKYLGSKNFKIWSYEVNEHCLITLTDKKLSIEDIENYHNWLKDQIKVLITPHPEHMQSYLTGVIATTKGIDPQAIEYLEKLQFSKSFKWGFQGWCDLRLLAVDVTSNQVISNKKAKEVQKVYQPSPVSEK